MESFVASLSPGPSKELDPCYAGYFTCFNRGEYYEAHDVLEHLWLRCTDSNYAFYKGLIQFAGAFVHLRKHHLRPDHPKDSRRLAPAARLFDLASANLTPFSPRHFHLEVADVIARADALSAQIRASGFLVNPWNPDALPQLTPTSD
jgi:hypothetical protein